MVSKTILGFGTDMPTDVYVQEFLEGVNRTETGWRSIFVPQGVPVRQNVEFDCIVGLGVLRGNAERFRVARDLGKPFIHLDHAYFSPGYHGQHWLRASVNGLQFNSRFCKTSPRLSFEEISNRTQKADLNWDCISRVLLLPPSSGTCYFNTCMGAKNLSNWVSDVTSILRLVTRREISCRIRQKPGEYVVEGGVPVARREVTLELERSLDDDISSVDLVVTYNSVAAVRAMNLGKPVLGDRGSFLGSAGFILEADVTREPIVGGLLNYEVLLRDLTYAQWNAEERKNGTCWRAMIKLHPELSKATS